MLYIWIFIFFVSIILFLLLLLSSRKLKIKLEEKVLLILFELFTAFLIPGVLYFHFIDTYGPFDLKQGIGQFGTAVLSYIFNMVIYFFYNLLSIYINKWIPRLMILAILIAVMVASYLIASFTIGWTPDLGDEEMIYISWSYATYGMEYAKKGEFI